MRCSINTAIILLMSSFCPSEELNRNKPINNYVIFPNDYNNNYYRYDSKPQKLPTNPEELSLPQIHKLNEVAYSDDFARLYNIPIPRDPPETAMVITGGRTGVVTESKKMSSEGADFPQAGCVPDVVPVKLQIYKEPHTHYFPTCTRLPRCGGCCFSSMVSCQPEEQEPVLIKVLKAKMSGPSPPRRRSRLTAPSSKYIIVKETRHLKCSCQCKIKLEDCDPKVHKYEKDHCACTCKNEGLKKSCHKKHKTHLWDSKTCRCVCKEEHQCSSGEYFSHHLCRCTHKESKPADF